MTSATELRRQVRAQRRALAPELQQQFSSAICRNVATLPWVRTARRIAMFWPHEGEPDLMAFARGAWKRNRRVYLPVLASPHSNHLAFALYRRGAPLVCNVFGIPEPKMPQAHWVSGSALDVVLVPLVAFDAAGHRLGMGGGFYDRTFSYLRYRKHWRKPRLIGVAYEFQKVSALHAQPWDVTLDAVVTERDIYRWS